MMILGSNYLWILVQVMVVLPSHCYTASVFSESGLSQLVTLAAAHLCWMEEKVMDNVLMDNCFDRSILAQCNDWRCEEQIHNSSAGEKSQTAQEQYVDPCLKTLGRYMGAYISWNIRQLGHRKRLIMMAGGRKQFNYRFKEGKWKQVNCEWKSHN